MGVDPSFIVVLPEVSRFLPLGLRVLPCREGGSKDRGRHLPYHRAFWTLIYHHAFPVTVPDMCSVGLLTGYHAFLVHLTVLPVLYCVLCLFLCEAL